MAVILKAVEATIGPDGRIVTATPLHFERPTKVIPTVAVEEDDTDLAVASGAAWAAKWCNRDEDEAWAGFQEGRSCWSGSPSAT